VGEQHGVEVPIIDHLRNYVRDLEKYKVSKNLPTNNAITCVPVFEPQSEEE
jgi:hypothetical protein